MIPDPEFPSWLRAIAVLAVEIALATGIAGVLDRFIRAPAWRRTLWQAAALSLLAMLTLNLAGWPDGLNRFASASPRFAGTPDEETSRTGLQPPSRPGQPVSAPGIQPTSDQTARSVLPAVNGYPSSPEIRASESRRTHANVNRVMSAVLFEAAWVTGIVVTGLRIGLACLTCGLMRIRGIRLVHIEARVEALAREFGTSAFQRQIRVIECTRLKSPLAFGWFRPTIALPEGFLDSLASGARDAVLAHEIAHLQGRDPWWYLLMDFNCALLWWHPAVWWSRRRLQAASESAADEASLLVHEGPRHLAECLVRLGTALTGGKRFFRAGIQGGGFKSELGYRVERLFEMREATWKPVRRGPAFLARTAGPAALTLVVVFGCAWTIPSTNEKGNDMKSIWKNSWLAWALLSAPVLEPQAAAATSFKVPILGDLPFLGQLFRSESGWNPQTPVSRSSSMGNALADARLLAQMGFNEEARLKLNDVLNVDPGNLEARRELMLLAEKRDTSSAQSASSNPAPFVGRGSRGSANSTVGGGGSSLTQDAFGQRAAAPPGTGAGAVPVGTVLAERPLGPMDARLREIVLEEVFFDGIPLGDVLRSLNEQTRALDPDKIGVNFLLNPNGPPDVSIDPVTGAQTSSPASDPYDILIRFNIPLRKMRLVDVLDAIVKVADRPVQYTVEDYGVVFHQSSSGVLSVPRPNLFSVITLRTDTNSFVASLKSTFGVEIPADASGTGVAQALRKLFTQLGMDMTPAAKAVYYNPLTGALMVRATHEDLEIVRAAIETLASPQSSFEAASTEAPGISNLMRTRYGLMPPSAQRTGNNDNELRMRYGLPPRTQVPAPSQDADQRP